MAEGGSSAGSKPSRGESRLRVLKAATIDAAFPLLRPSADLPMLLAFVERFDRLGWLPPVDEQKRKLLEAHDVQMHVVRDKLCFYEFCSKGFRGERDPWLSIFFHVDDAKRVRICGVSRTDAPATQRREILRQVARRVQELDEWLSRRRER